MRRLFLISTVALFCFTCSSNSDTETEEGKKLDYERKIRLDSLNALASSYGAAIGFDTLRFSFTYQYQDFLKNNNKLIFSRYKINDVSKQDSVYIISLEMGYLPKLFIDLTCNEDQLNELLPYKSEKRISRIRRSNKFIIATIASIDKIKYKIDTDEISLTKKETDVYLELDATDAFLVKGKLIDVFKFRSIKKTNL